MKKTITRIILAILSTPLRASAYVGHPQITKLLVSKEANGKAKEKSGWTAWPVTAYTWQQARWVKLPIDKGVSLL